VSLPETLSAPRSNLRRPVIKSAAGEYNVRESDSSTQWGTVVHSGLSTREYVACPLRRKR
jgi:hypothetical protein